MKSPAIVSFLWESQLGVLRAFFNRHGPMTVVTLSPYVTDTLTTIIEQSGSRLFVVDHELGDAGAYAVQAEYEPLRGVSTACCARFRRNWWKSRWRRWHRSSVRGWTPNCPC